MPVCPTPVTDRRQRAGVTLICRYLPHHVLTLPRLAPYVAEAEKGERCPIRVRVVLAAWSVAAEVDEARLVRVQRELVPSKTRRCSSIRQLPWRDLPWLGEPTESLLTASP